MRRNAHIPPERLKKILSALQGADWVLSLLLAETGYRLDDVMHLRVWQLRGDRLSIVERKTGHTRECTIRGGLGDVLKAYTAGRSSLAYAFPALRRYGRRKMHRSTYWRHFQRACEWCGYEGCGYTPHSLRKVYAVNALARTGSLRAVQADLGHTSIGVTALYALADRVEGDTA